MGREWDIVSFPVVAVNTCFSVFIGCCPGSPSTRAACVAVMLTVPLKPLARSLAFLTVWGLPGFGGVVQKKLSHEFS